VINYCSKISLSVNDEENVDKISELLLEKARRFAIQAHQTQEYGNQPYVYHLDAVVAHLKPYSVEAQVVGYLHDVIEDTTTSYTDIKGEFGGLVADCVSILSDEAGASRKERKALTYKKMAAVSGELELALTVKVADRLANMEACQNDNKLDLLNIYKSEHAVFKSSVYRCGSCDDLWEKIQAIMDA